MSIGDYFLTKGCVGCAIWAYGEFCATSGECCSTRGVLFGLLFLAVFDFRYGTLRLEGDGMKPLGVAPCFLTFSTSLMYWKKAHTQIEIEATALDFDLMLSASN